MSSVPPLGTAFDGRPQAFTDHPSQPKWLEIHDRQIDPFDAIDQSNRELLAEGVCFLSEPALVEQWPDFQTIMG